MSTSYGTGPAAGQYSIDPENQLQPEDTLLDRGTDDMLDEGYSPPEQPYGPGAYGPRESLDQLLAEEEPDPAAWINTADDDERRSADDAERETEFPEHREVGTVRAGRLVAPDMGFGEDAEADCVAEDVGISGGAASAEEAAMHVISDDLVDED